MRVRLTLLDEVLDVLALQLSNDELQALSISIDTDGAQHLLDVGSAGGLVSAQDGEQVSSHVTHSGKAAEDGN